MRRHVCSLAIAVAVTACGYFKKDNPHRPTKSPHELLDERADLYCRLGDDLADQWGFLGDCGDAVGFAALRAVGCPDSPIDVAAAEIAGSGAWDRDAAHACFPERTATRDSRDMVLMRLFWIWQHERLDLIERMITHGERSGWVICEGRTALEAKDRCTVRSNLRATLYELRFRLGGADSDERKNWQFEDPTATGYQAHLSVLHVFLRGLMFGAVSDAGRDWLANHASRAPDNQLFRAAYLKFKDGNMAGPTSWVLEHEALFPADRLPTSQDRKAHYLWERDEGDDWRPDTAATATHGGVDLAFLRAIIADKLRVTSYQGLALEGETMHRYRRRDE